MEHRNAGLARVESLELFVQVCTARYTLIQGVDGRAVLSAGLPVVGCDEDPGWPA